MKKIITIMLTFVFMLCFSVAAFAAQTYNIGYYAIPKANFSPKDPLIMNKLVRYDGQNPQYYRFFAVYATHDHDEDMYNRNPNFISLRIATNAAAYPVEKVANGWKNIKTYDLDTGIIIAGVDVKLSGAFAALPASITVQDSATGSKTLYQDMNPPKDYPHYDTLNMNTALIDILNITGPHPGWDSKIGGSKRLPY